MINLKKITAILVCVIVGNSFLMGMDEMGRAGFRYNLGFISSVLVSPNNKYYASVFNNGILQVFKLYSKQNEHILQVENISGMASFSPDDSRGTLIAYGVHDGFVKIMRVENKEVVLEFKAFDSRIDIVSFSCDGQFLAVVSSNEIRICKVETGARVKSMIRYQGPISSLQWSPDGNYIAFGDITGGVIIWDVQMEYQVYSIKGDGVYPGCVAWSQDAGYLAVGSNNRIVICGKGEYGRFDRSMLLQESVKEIGAISWHSSGNLIVTVADGVARLWNTKNYECLRNLSGAIYSTNSAAFSPDGNRLVMNIGPRLVSNRAVTDIFISAKCAMCGANSEDLVEKIPNGKGSCLVCPNCKILRREQIPFIPC